MKVGTSPEGMIERALLALNQVPVPIPDTLFTAGLARSIMAATKFGIFDLLAEGPNTVAAIAAGANLNSSATAKLLHVLLAAGYVESLDDNLQQFRLSALSKRWLVSTSAVSVAPFVLFNYENWKIIEHFETYLQTGEGLDFHAHYGPEEWKRYQRAMAAVAGSLAKETAAKLPAPPNPRKMLDIGGGHCRYAVEMCRRHKTLSAVVFDLPSAVEAAAPLLAEQGMGDRVLHIEGDATAADFGETLYDVVFMAQLAHHLIEDQNRDLAKRVARALKRDGVFAIWEQIAIHAPSEAKRRDRKLGTILDLFFGASSASGTWSIAQIQSWLTEAGLKALKPVALLRGPGTFMVCGRKV